MKTHHKFILLLVIPVFSYAQDTTVVKKQAETVAVAEMKGHYEVVTEHTYPKLLLAVGGKDKMTATIKQAMEMLKNQGFSITSITIGTPGKFYKAGSEIHCLVPQMIVMTSSNGRLVNNGNLLAVSKDGGKFWYFLDINRGTYSVIPKLFPNFNKNLIIPEPRQPGFD
ncbi:MAG: hypothetical protein ACHQHN_06845 [Sphingobacteriales bacterium]